MSSIKKNYLLNLSYQLLNLIIPFATAPYVSRVLKVDGVGLWSFVCAETSYFFLLGVLGTATFGQKEIAASVNNIKERTNVFWNIELLSVFSMLLAASLFFVYSLFKPERTLYFICGLQFLGGIFDISWFYNGIEKFSITVTRNIIFRIISLVGIFTFVKSESDIYVYAFFVVGVSALGNIMMWLPLKKYITKTKVKLNLLGCLKGSVIFFIPTIAIQIYTQLDKVMLGYMTESTTQNGYYEQAQKIIKIALTIVASLGTVMMSRNSKLYAEGKVEEIKENIYKSTRLVWMLSIPLCFGVICVADVFVPLFFGDGYDKVVEVLFILSWLIIIIGLSNVSAYQYLVPIGKQSQFTKTVVLGTVVNLIFNIILIPRYYVMGAAYATIIAELSVTVSEFWLMRKAVSIRKVLLPAWRNWIAGLFMVICIILAKKYVHYLNNDILATFGLIVIGAVSYFTMLTILRDDFFLINVRMLLKRIRRK